MSRTVRNIVKEYGPVKEAEANITASEGGIRRSGMRGLGPPAFGSEFCRAELRLLRIPRKEPAY
jgi:hypothetical protein